MRLLTKRLNRLRREHASRFHEDDDEEDEYAEDQSEDEARASVSAMQPPLDRNDNLRRTVHSQQRRLWGAHSLLLDWVVRPASCFTAHQPSTNAAFLAL